VAWLWALAPRAGPIRADPEPARRRLLDHLRANGRLLWAQGARAELVRAAREWALERVAHEHPHVRSLAPAERAQFLERRYRLPHAWAQLLADNPSIDTPSRLVALARACRALHVQLRSRGAAHDPLYDPTSEDAP